MGKSWSYVSTIAAGPVEQEGYPEPVIVRLTQGRHKGRWICLMRTGRENPLYQSHSDDEGMTWSRPKPLTWTFSRYGRTREIVGTDPDLIELHDGTLAASFGHKPDFHDDGNFLMFSVDQGESWTQVTRLSHERTCAYTTLRETQPGTIFVTYSVKADSGKEDSSEWHYRSYWTVGRNVNFKRRADMPGR